MSSMGDIFKQYRIKEVMAKIKRIEELLEGIPNGIRMERI